MQCWFVIFVLPLMNLWGKPCNDRFTQSLHQISVSLGTVDGSKRVYASDQSKSNEEFLLCRHSKLRRNCCHTDGKHTRISTRRLQWQCIHDAAKFRVQPTKMKYHTSSSSVSGDIHNETSRPLWHASYLPRSLVWGGGEDSISSLSTVKFVPRHC